jgi:hypothetical protein
VDLQHLLEDKDIHAVYVSRWRADHVAKSLWRIAKGRIRWHTMPLKPSHAAADGCVGVTGGSASRGARYLTVRIEPCFVLGVEKHEVRLWHTDFRLAYRQLTIDQQTALDEYLLGNRMSSVFYLVRKWVMVRRSDNATGELAEAVMAIAGQAVEVAAGKEVETT